MVVVKANRIPQAQVPVTGALNTASKEDTMFPVYLKKRILDLTIGRFLLYPGASNKVYERTAAGLSCCV
jgi:hypothetical protein